MAFKRGDLWIKRRKKKKEKANLWVFGGIIDGCLAWVTRLSEHEGRNCIYVWSVPEGWHWCVTIQGLCIRLEEDEELILKKWMSRRKFQKYPLELSHCEIAHVRKFCSTELFLFSVYFGVISYVLLIDYNFFI